MESARLLPAALAADSIEVLLAERGPAGQGVYLLTLALVVAGLGALPVIRVPVWVESGGILRPAVEKQEVRTAVAGVMESLRVRENQEVRRGEVIATLRPGSLWVQDSLLQRQITSLHAEIGDLEALLADGESDEIRPERLRTGRYRLELLHLRKSAEEQRQRAEVARREAERATALHARDLISASEAEQRAADLEREEAAAALQVQRTRLAWEADLARQRDALRELEGRAAETRQRAEHLTLAAPVSGAVEQLASLSPGSPVQAGERIAVISPEAALVAEVLVPPAEIGMLRAGMPVRMRLDAYRSSDWGLLPGEVAEIPADAVVIDQALRYRVRIALHASSLRLPDGTSGELRKGMTLQARFVLTERSLWQLLREDVDDWLGAREERGPGR